MTRAGRDGRRREFAPLPPGTATVRIAADHDLTRQYLRNLLLGDEQIRVIKGPDEYDGGRIYLTLQVVPFADDPGQ